MKKLHGKTAVSICLLSLLTGGIFPPSAMAILFNGEVRIRPEYRDNADFNKDTTDTLSFIGSRIRLMTTTKALDDVLIKITLQDTRNFGSETSPVGLTDSGEAVDIHEGYAEISNLFKSPFALRAGRQELVYGDQRLIGSFGWNNQGRAFDAFKLMFSNGDFALDGWLAKRKENNGAAAGSPNIDRDFYGLYGTLKTLLPKSVWDLYVLFDREGDTAPAVRKKAFFTVGTRIAGKVPIESSMLDYTVEAPYQFGDNGTRVAKSSEDVKIDAYALAAKLGFTFPGDNAIRIGGEYDFASGDDNAGDATSRTFNNLYPTNHLFYGYMDYQSWRNMMGWNANVSGSVFEKKLFLSSSFWGFKLADAKDAWYDAAGNAASTVRTASATNGETDVGNEIDLIARYDYNTQVQIEAGWGYFFRGDYIKSKLANSGDSNWSYIMMTVKF